MGIFLTELFGLFVVLEQSNAIHRRPTADPGHSHLYKSRDIAENCGVRLSSQTHIISIKCTCTRQILVLFSSIDTKRTIFFVLWKNPIAQSRVSPISLLVVGYEETCHAVTTLPFILRVFFLLFEYIFLRISRLKFAKF